MNVMNTSSGGAPFGTYVEVNVNGERWRAIGLTPRSAIVLSHPPNLNTLVLVDEDDIRDDLPSELTTIALVARAAMKRAPKSECNAKKRT